MMAEGGVGRLDCSICLEKFTKPKLLPCYHTFCTTCLENYIEKNSNMGKFYCPLCRKSIEVPTDGVAGFQSNFYIETGEVEAIDSPISCDVCGPESTADHRCLDCDENFCPSCTKAHAAMKMTRHHNLVQVQADDTGLNLKLTTRVFCKVHPRDEIRLICKQCEELLCVVCMLTEHHGHKSREVTQEATDLKVELRKVMEDERTINHEKKLSVTIADLKMDKEHLVDGLDKEKLRLKKHAEKIYAAVDLLVEDREREIEKEYKDLVDSNQERLHALETVHKSWTSLLATSEQILKHDTDIGIIMQGQNLRRQIEKQRDAEANMGKGTSDLTESLYKEGKVDNKLLRDMIGAVNHPRKATKQVLKSSPTNQASNASTVVQNSPAITPVAGRLHKTRSFVIRSLLGSIYGITPAGSDTFWFSGNYTKLALCDLSGNVLLDLNVGSYCITSDKDGNCIAACPINNCVKRITTTGKIETIIDNTPEPPHGIAYRIQPDGTEEIVFSSHTGVYIASYHKGAKVSLLSSGYSSALCIAIHEQTGNIAVADRAVGVSIIDQTGQFLGKYPVDTEFSDVFGVCYEDQGCVLAISSGSRKIGRLRPDGSLMEVLPKDTSTTGYRLCCDRNNNLLIGGSGGQVDVYKISK